MANSGPNFLVEPVTATSTNGDSMDETGFIELTLSNAINREILARLPALGLSDAWLVSGALFQTAWNRLTNRFPEYGIKDYDIFYFDLNTSYEAEDEAIARANVAFADLRGPVEVRNQARVHLWYGEIFGMPYSPVGSATDSIDRFLMQHAQVGIRLRGRSYDVYAPRGFADIEHLIVRPNLTPNFCADRYRQKAARWKALWPEITILEPTPT
jgi:hypothetical protein